MYRRSLSQSLLYIVLLYLLYDMLSVALVQMYISIHRVVLHFKLIAALSRMSIYVRKVKPQSF